MAMLEQLEKTATPVTAAARPARRWTCGRPQRLSQLSAADDAAWITTLFILCAFSYEAYYWCAGLARSMIRPEHFDVAQRAMSARQWIRPRCRLRFAASSRPVFRPAFFAASAFGRLAAANQGYRVADPLPGPNYYGKPTSDQGRYRTIAWTTTGMGNTTVEAVTTGTTSHRGTFATAVRSGRRGLTAAAG
jgi:hypothetical protein